MVVVKNHRLINVGITTKQRFNPSQSVGTRHKTKQTNKQTNIPQTATTREKQQPPTDTEHFVVHEQIDRLLITETWLGCRGDEAKCVHDALGNRVAPFPPSATCGPAFIARDAILDQLSPHRNSSTSSALRHLPIKERRSAQIGLVLRVL